MKIPDLGGFHGTMAMNSKSGIFKPSLDSLSPAIGVGPFRLVLGVAETWSGGTAKSRKHVEFSWTFHGIFITCWWIFTDFFMGCWWNMGGFTGSLVLRWVRNPAVGRWETSRDHPIVVPVFHRNLNSNQLVQDFATIHHSYQ